LRKYYKDARTVEAVPVVIAGWTAICVRIRVRAAPSVVSEKAPAAASSVVPEFVFALCIQSLTN
jgi:hypothetical protein